MKSRSSIKCSLFIPLKFCFFDVFPETISASVRSLHEFHRYRNQTLAFSTVHEQPFPLPHYCRMYQNWTYISVLGNCVEKIMFQWNKLSTFNVVMASVLTLWPRGLTYWTSLIVANRGFAWRDSGNLWKFCQGTSFEFHMATSIKIAVVWVVTLFSMIDR